MVLIIQKIKSNIFKWIKNNKDFDNNYKTPSCKPGYHIRKRFIFVFIEWFLTSQFFLFDKPSNVI